MKIFVADLQPDKNIVISGRESWLEPIYQDFESALEHSDPKSIDGQRGNQQPINGELQVEKLTESVVKVSGWLTYAPILPCSRCMCTVSYPMDLTVSVYFQQRGINDFDRDHSLRKGELEEYYFDGDTMDLAPVVNDTIQTAIPSTVAKPTPDGSKCAECQEDLATDLIYGKEPESAEENPFAALKNWRPPN